MAAAFIKAMGSRFEWLSLVQPGVEEVKYLEYCEKTLTLIVANLKLCKTVLGVSDSVTVLNMVNESPLIDKVKAELILIVTTCTDVDGVDKAEAHPEADGTNKKQQFGE